jgi:SAM-dependent methyltransferase
MQQAYLKNFTSRLFKLLNLNTIRAKYINQAKEEKKKMQFYSELVKFNSEQKLSSRALAVERLIPFLNDSTSNTSFDPHYIYHPAWAARILQKTNPEYHIDISSTVTFCSIVSAFIPIHFYDYRPANIQLNNLHMDQANLMCLPFETNSVNSISCMHTVEHIGLGRYGDPIDYNGDIKAMKEISRVLIPTGNLLFVVPVGKRRIEFNAHRIYHYEDIINAFPELELVEFSLVPDNYEETGMILNPSCELINSQNWGCGCYWFTKK